MLSSIPTQIPIDENESSSYNDIFYIIGSNIHMSLRKGYFNCIYNVKEYIRNNEKIPIYRQMIYSINDDTKLLLSEHFSVYGIVKNYTLYLELTKSEKELPVKVEIGIHIKNNKHTHILDVYTGTTFRELKEHMAKFLNFQIGDLIIDEGGGR